MTAAAAIDHRFACPMMVERLRENLSRQKPSERIARMLREPERTAR